MIRYFYKENQNDKDVFYTSMYVLFRQNYKINMIMHMDILHMDIIHMDIIHMYFMCIMILKRFHSDDDMYKMLYYHNIMYTLEYLQKK